MIFLHANKYPCCNSHCCTVIILPAMECAVLCFLKGVLYSAWWWCAVSVSVACVLFAVLLARSDCDLVLAFYSRWGKKPVSALFGKVVWVTGASSGLGQELCYFLSKCGAIVVLSARREEELQRVLKRCIGKERQDLGALDHRAIGFAYRCCT